MKTKKILIISATHGNEKIGVEVVKMLRQKKLNRYFDFLIANPKALRENKRFLDADLNRSYPGRKNSPIYEKKLAYENFQKAKKYKYIIDIHEASEGINNFIIVPRRTVSKKFPLGFINMKLVLLWPEPKGPLGGFLENAVELEFGMKNKQRKKVVAKAEQIITNFINNICCQNKITYKRRQKLYYVYDFLRMDNPFSPLKRFKDFKKTVFKGEEFYPLLVGQYIKEKIVCYKMKLLNKTKEPL